MSIDNSYFLSFLCYLHKGTRTATSWSIRTTATRNDYCSIAYTQQKINEKKYCFFII